jgi:hypothetical protein
MSKAALTERISKLNLQKGDIVVCKDMETMNAIQGLGRVVDFTVPLVFAPQGITKLSRQDLLNLLEQVEQSDKSVLPAYGISEQPSAPL